DRRRVRVGGLLLLRREKALPHHLPAPGEKRLDLGQDHLRGQGLGIGDGHFPSIARRPFFRDTLNPSSRAPRRMAVAFRRPTLSAPPPACPRRWPRAPRASGGSW